MDELVQRLTKGKHPLTLGGSRPFLEDFQRGIQDMGYVFLKFTGTRGDTDLGIRVDKNATDLTHANFERRTGIAHIEGTLTLNYVKVRCVADIDLETLDGTGHLIVLEQVGL